MKGLGFILFIIAVQVISAIIAHRKKQAERKAKEEAAARTMAQSPTLAGGTPPTAQANGGQAAASVPAGTSGDLESRRREQLEQLRQRRDSRRVGIPTTSPLTNVRPGTMPPFKPAQRGGPVVIAQTSIGTSEQSRIKAQEAQRRAKEAERLRREQQAQVVREQEAIASRDEHLAYEKAFHSVAGEADGPAHGAGGKRSGGSTGAVAAIGAALGRRGGGGSTGGGGDRAGVTAAALAGRLGNPATIRELMILREIVDRPLSLREG